LRIALRQESDRLDAGDNYAIGDTESEDSGPEDKYNSDPKSESTENDKISDIINIQWLSKVMHHLTFNSNAYNSPTTNARVMILYLF